LPQVGVRFPQWPQQVLYRRLNATLRQPAPSDYAGSIVIEGRKYWLNGWMKDGEKGKFLSLSAKPAEEPKTKPAARDWQRPDRDEIPF